jgi:Fe(3+) dicitrate transport protein
MYHLSDSWKLFANANTSFGSLQYFQLTRGGSGGQPAPGLEPEKAKTYEIGTRYDDTVVKAELTAFYIDFNNQLQYINNTIGWTSLGATKHKGVELALSYDLSEMTHALDGASVYSSYTYTKATAVNGAFADKDLPFYSRQVFTVGTRYEVGNWVWNVDGYAQSKQRSPGSADSGNGYITDESADGQYGDIMGYMTWNARGEYDFGPRWSHLKVGAGIKNLFDERYFTRSTDNNSGKYVGEPRTYFVQASLAF